MPLRRNDSLYKKKKSQIIIINLKKKNAFG